MSSLPLGIALGVGAAALQSLTYLQSRHVVGQAADGQLRLLVVAHAIQGAVSLALLPLLWPANMPDWTLYAGPIMVESLGYLAGQACLFAALRHTEASRVAPFLGLKVALLAVLTWLLRGRGLTPMQWTAVALAVSAAWLLHWTATTRTPAKAIFALLGACAGYAISDLYIGVAIERMAPVSPLHAALTACALSYAFCGLSVLPLWGRVRHIGWSDVRRSSPYALTWLSGMGLLYTCFALAGVVLGNIVQSSRGLISILIAPWLARHADWGHLETAHPPHAVARRAACALLMTAAVALYVLGRARP
ncbi:MAG: DMT family transporter [Lentisphaerae bacterium]|nr:DMT family transporter [Lentisphaerota bacterium]